jgi:hypothetical protein
MLSWRIGHAQVTAYHADLQVALLFLVRGALPHERTWAAWLGDAAEYVPTPAVVQACCGNVHGSGRPAGSRTAATPSAADSREWRNAAGAAGARHSKAAGSGAQPDGTAGSSFAAEAAERRLQGTAAWRQRDRRRSLQWLRRGQKPVRSKGVVAAQRLFSVYAHPAPDFAGYPRGHLFHRRELPHRVQARRAMGTYR